MHSMSREGESIVAIYTKYLLLVHCEDIKCMLPHETG